MKFFKIFYSLFIVSALIFSSCSGSETNDTSTESSTEGQVDTIPFTDDEPAKIDEENVDDKPVENKTGNQVKAKKKTTKKTVENPSENPSENQEKVKIETVKKSEPAKTTTYNFIIATEGKQISDDFKGDLMTSAAEEVYIEKKGKCGNEDCGKKIILVNMNQDKSIDVAVQISWKENDNKINKKRSYNLKSSQKLEIGCSSKCDVDNFTIKWNIIGATYSK